ncbi:GumC family protein [Desulfofustis limnaeus]|uniref:Lipopolysaccharide biosynthesis protein n=1 Tax=Desulfofustis limnaeus TaxID=2740163 RepID=A0ABN6M6F2_9BACT|nr:hypothetical protein [Desulfofustis limnaeus]BDD87639.1 hypothetical protein DPPLL_20040 [Desulfofustis limnaeus]
MNHHYIQLIRRWVDVAFRRKTTILFFALVGLFVGLGYYLSEPKFYRSTALLSYEQQRINPTQMSPDVVARIRETINTVTHIVLSRSSLERIIHDLNLRDETSKSSMEDEVEWLRQRVIVEPSRQGDTFSINHLGTDPVLVEKVTNALADRFIEENMKYREERAAETSQYTQDELAMAKEILDVREAEMRDYKLRHFDEMPEQREGNLARLNSLQEQYQNRQNSIQDLERTRVLIQEQINLRRQILTGAVQAQTGQVTAVEAPTPVETDQQRLARLEQTLQSLLGRYTEQHPEIRQLRREIALLQENIGPDAGAETGTAAGRGSRASFDQELFDLEIQMKDVVLNIKKLNEERAELQKSIDRYESWIEAVPQREAEWSALTREYAELRRHYDELVAQNLQASAALNLERKQKGSQFKIEDRARIPEKPIKPIFSITMALALFAGLGLGILLAVGKELIDLSFRSPDEVESELGVEVVCSIPYVPLPNETRKQRLKQVAVGCALFLGFVGWVVMVVMFWQRGQIIL